MAAGTWLPFHLWDRLLGASPTAPRLAQGPRGRPWWTGYYGYGQTPFPEALKAFEDNARSCSVSSQMLFPTSALSTLRGQTVPAAGVQAGPGEPSSRYLPLTWVTLVSHCQRKWDLGSICGFLPALSFRRWENKALVQVTQSAKWQSLARFPDPPTSNWGFPPIRRLFLPTSLISPSCGKRLTI